LIGIAETAEDTESAENGWMLDRHFSEISAFSGFSDSMI